MTGVFFVYYKGLKQASRACLKGSGSNSRRIIFIYLLVVFFLDVPYSLISTFLEHAMSTASGGLGALKLLHRYHTWYNLAPFILLLASMLWSVGLTAFCLHLSQGKNIGSADLFAGFRNFGRVLWLAVREWFFITLWSFLFFIPGLVAAYRYRMAVYALLDEPAISAREAMEISKRITAGHKLELFVLDLSFWWYYLLTSLLATAGSINTVVQVLQLYGLSFATETGGLSLWSSFGTYLAAELALLVFNYCTTGYVQTTYAHSYNYLRQLGDDRYLG